MNKTQLVPLIGDPAENLYQLGKKEAEAFKRLETRVTKLLSSNNFLRYGQDIVSRAKALLKKKENTFFDQCINAYAEGLGIEASEYMSFLSLFELAAHYGQIYPELKGLLPGCSTVFERAEDGISHSRILDFPLIGIFEEAPRLYYWKIEGKQSIMNYSCEGLAPLFFQAIHQSGFSMALHHKPGGEYRKDGQNIFQIAFDGLFEATSMNDFRKELKKTISVTKWGFYMVDDTGTVVAMDLDGPASNMETFSLRESPVLVFNNIPIRHDAGDSSQYLEFCHHRQDWLREKMQKKGKTHTLDALTDVKDQKVRGWRHPGATLSSVAAIKVNLTHGHIDLKEGSSALVASDAIVRFSLGDDAPATLLKAKAPESELELAWKRAALAQSAYDQGSLDEAYHHLQIAHAIMPLSVWKEIFSFYLHLWNFKFVSHKRELSLIYRDVKKLEVPELLRDQWIFLCMRLEKKLGLAFTVREEDVAPNLRDAFRKEKEAGPAVFATWMKLLYPRLEILDVFSPQHR